jgi:hypothetical protein
MGGSECSRGTLEYSHGVLPPGTSTHARTHARTAGRYHDGAGSKTGPFRVIAWDADASFGFNYAGRRGHCGAQRRPPLRPPVAHTAAQPAQTPRASAGFDNCGRAGHRAAASIVAPVATLGDCAATAASGRNGWSGSTSSRRGCSASANTTGRTSTGGPAPRNVQQAGCNIKQATCNVQQAARNVQHAASNRQHATGKMQGKMNRQRAACCGQQATCNRQRARGNVQEATCNRQRA